MGPSSAGGEPRITAVVVSYQSAAVLGACLDSLAAAAPRRGVRTIVVDNASSDGSAELAAHRVGPKHVIRLAANRGFAAGVNAVLADFAGEWLAVINPDAVTPPGSLDALADVLERHPRAGLVGPRIRNPGGAIERSVGWFPTLARERAHALYMDRWAGREGRWFPFPGTTRAVDWISGAAWLLRGEAIRVVGALDEVYFMYYEDVDYCRRLHDAGWEVLACPEVEVDHGLGGGSAVTEALPASGGAALLHYFEKFEPTVPREEVRRVLVRIARTRLWMHALRARLGSPRSAGLARRYRLALEALRASA